MTENERNRLRRQHVQSTRKDVAGFCPKCDAIIVGSTASHACAKGKKLFIVDAEEPQVPFRTIKGDVIRTTRSGWRLLPIRGEDRYVKRVHDGEGGLAVITSLEALACRVEGAKGSSPMFLPSARTSSLSSVVTSSKPQPKVRTAKTVDLSDYELGTQLSKEAKKLSRK